MMEFNFDKAVQVDRKSEICTRLPNQRHPAHTLHDNLCIEVTTFFAPPRIGAQSKDQPVIRHEVHIGYTEGKNPQSGQFVHLMPPTANARPYKQVETNHLLVTPQSTVDRTKQALQDAHDELLANPRTHQRVDHVIETLTSYATTFLTRRVLIQTAEQLQRRLDEEDEPHHSGLCGAMTFAVHQQLKQRNPRGMIGVENPIRHRLKLDIAHITGIDLGLQSLAYWLIPLDQGRYVVPVADEAGNGDNTDPNTGTTCADLYTAARMDGTAWSTEAGTLGQARRVLLADLIAHWKHTTGYISHD